MFLAGEKRQTRVFQKPNILRRKPRFEEPSSSTSAPILIHKCADAFVNAEYPKTSTQPVNVRKHRCSKRSHAARIRLDSYFCIRKLDGAEAGGLHSAPSQTALDVPTDSCSGVDNGGRNTKRLSLRSEQSTQRVECEQDVQRDPYEAKGFEEMFPDENSTKAHLKFSEHFKTTKPVRPLLMICPAWVAGDENNTCDLIFQSREELVEHIKEGHTRDDAPHRCDTCSRSFFWCSGLRAHTRVHTPTARPLFDCRWPGCSRVFSQACRLKEHARSHTGDRPYSCGYTGCGWSFRTASKLVRHARRHTGERRHACRLCGAAFLRREHMRQHELRHTAAQHRCRHTDCQRVFKNQSSVYIHMKKAHAPVEVRAVAVDIIAAEGDTFRAARTHVTHPLAKREHPNTPGDDGENPSDDKIYGLQNTDQYGSGATQLTNKSTAQSINETKLKLHLQNGSKDEGAMSLDKRYRELHVSLLGYQQNGRKNVHIGEIQSGSREMGPKGLHIGPIDFHTGYMNGPNRMRMEQEPPANVARVYTVRSDMFLHGDTPLRQGDSRESVELMAGGGDEERGVGWVTDLGLLDSADPIDRLLQEELMLTDATANEEPFQVLLLNGNDCH